MKKIRLFSSMLVFLLMLSGCSSQQEPINAKDLSEELVENVVFLDELRLTDDKTAKTLYDISDTVSAYVYIGSGATAEEIAVFEFKDESNAKRAVEKAEARINSQKDSFESYVPEEIKKLDNAIIKQSSRYLVVCISDGDEAEKIIAKHMK